MNRDSARVLNTIHHMRLGMGPNVAFIAAPCCLLHLCKVMILILLSCPYVVV